MKKRAFKQLCQSIREMGAIRRGEITGVSRLYHAKPGRGVKRIRPGETFTMRVRKEP